MTFSAHPPHGQIFGDEVPGCFTTEFCDLSALSESGVWETIHIRVQQGRDGGNSSTLQRKCSKGTTQLVNSYIMENYLCKNNNSLTAIPFLVLKKIISFIQQNIKVWSSYCVYLCIWRGGGIGIIIIRLKLYSINASIYRFSQTAN